MVGPAAPSLGGKTRLKGLEDGGDQRPGFGAGVDGLVQQPQRCTEQAGAVMVTGPELALKGLEEAPGEVLIRRLGVIRHGTV
jgi:hypothetical protein